MAEKKSARMLREEVRLREQMTVLQEEPPRPVKYVYVADTFRRLAVYLRNLADKTEYRL